MNHEQIAAKLEEKNIRPSVQRMAIYNFLAENPVHPTVDTIYTALSPQMPTLSRTTVYNTLRQFSECGLVQTITIEDGELRYDADTSNHLHFKCIKCGKIFDIFKPVELRHSFCKTDPKRKKFKPTSGEFARTALNSTEKESALPDSLPCNESGIPQQQPKLQQAKTKRTCCPF